MRKIQLPYAIWHIISSSIFCFEIGLLLVACFTVGAAQEPKSDLDKAPQSGDLPATRNRKVQEPPTEKTQPITDQERQALRREDRSEEEAAMLPYINNFFATTRLGPEDVITVDVFDQPNYSRSNLTIPPNGRINYPHIGQIIIAGRTADEVEKEITEKLSEYLREPVVTVQLVQVHSLKYLVIGDVAQPGIYEMSKRMTVTEALAKAGYVTRYGDLKHISVLRMQPGGLPAPIPVNLKEVTRGKAQDIYLAPGDTVVVPGNTFKSVEKVLGILSASYWARVIFR
jgi:polysaccharide export outer membrane protein